MDDLFGQIGKLRHAGIINVNFGMTCLWGRKCTVVGDNLTARDALEQILDQLGMNLVPGIPRNRVAWALMYDPNWHEYFLSVALVPDMTPHESKAPPLPTGTSPATVTSSTGASRTTRFTPIKKN
ncbi:MAG TPA: hypothetical protein VG028_01400 [Terriglobia bacterium]|nr:hypothetical protein [Terriglobia bacterium]